MEPKNQLDLGTEKTAMLLQGCPVEFAEGAMIAAVIKIREKRGNAHTIALIEETLRRLGEQRECYPN